MLGQFIGFYNFDGTFTGNQKIQQNLSTNSRKGSSVEMAKHTRKSSKMALSWKGFMTKSGQNRVKNMVKYRSVCHFP